MISFNERWTSRNTSTFTSNGVECLVTALHYDTFKLQLATVYRSPTVPIRQFLNFMSIVLIRISATDITTVVLGDFNDNILCPARSQVETLMVSQGYTQLVQSATTDNGTLIDHVYLNRECTNVVMNVRDVYYSDHDAVYCSLPMGLLQ